MLVELFISTGNEILLIENDELSQKTSRCKCNEQLQPHSLQFTKISEKKVEEKG